MRRGEQKGGRRKNHLENLERNKEIKMNSEKQLEFDKIKEIWMALAVTEKARERIKNLSFYLSERELRRELRDTTNSREMLEKAGTPPLQNVDEIKGILLTAEKGGCLTPDQLERAGNILTVIRRLKDYLNKGKLFENPLAYYEENLNTNEELREEIAGQIRGGAVDDRASKELSQIRLKMARCEEQMRQKAEQTLRSHQSCMADHFCAFRNGRLCVPVKKEYKSRIPGQVIDRSATGNTLFIEPAAVAGYGEELQLLKISEENEIYRILYTLTAMVGEEAPAIRESVQLMEKLDFIFSKGKLSIDLGGTEPSINTERRIILKDGRHPLMDRERTVPLRFEIGEAARGIVITGPNTGGKTVAIKTVMLNCIMAQCGLHVTCGEADICMNNAYLCDIGDGQNLSENLSTFSAHIKNVLEVLKKADRDSFVIMDELGSGTDPAEGMGIAIAILEELRKSGANFLVTTHYPEVKEYADRTEKLLNARMTFDKETLEPTYQMVIGEAGESCAFYIADKLGMPRKMLQTAVRAAYGDEAAGGCRFREKPEKESIIEGGGSADRNTEKHSYGNPNRIVRIKETRGNNELESKYKIGDSVMVYPDKKIGIVCAPVNEKGVLRVQLPGKKIWINHKRVKLHVAADRLYPEDYDFSIIFDTVQNRKRRHEMSRKYTDHVIGYYENE